MVEAVTKEGCHSFDTIQISTIALPVVKLDHNAGLCIGDTRRLDAGNFPFYRWHDGSAGKTFIAKNTGTYYVEVTSQQGCKGSDTVHITNALKLPSGFLPADTAICSYGTFDIQPKQNFKTYSWNTNATTKMITVSQPGLYILRVTDDNNCSGMDSINLNVKNCLTGLYVPTAFTPNHDGKNDQLKAFLFGNIKSFSFKIFNRFGQLVFQSSNPAEGWNGMAGGVEQNSGTYVWSCSYQVQNT